MDIRARWDFGKSDKNHENVSWRPLDIPGRRAPPPNYSFIMFLLEDLEQAKPVHSQYSKVRQPEHKLSQRMSQNKLGIVSKRPNQAKRVSEDSQTVE